MDNQLILTQIEKAIAPAALPIFRLFTTPNFRHEWLLVTREMVCDHIGRAYNKNWQTDFIRGVVEPNLEPDRQYMQIPADHPLVEAYLHSDLNRNGDTELKPGNRRKYYMITGDAFQDACMMAGTAKGRIVRGYFKDMADLAERFLREHVEQADAKRRACEDEMAALNLRADQAEKKVAFIRTEFLDHLIKVVPDETLYMMTNWTSLQRGGWKFGITTDKVHKRLAGINTGHMMDDGHVVVHTWKCTSAKSAEDRVKNILACLRDNDNREFFRGPYRLLVDAVTWIVDGLNEDREYCSKQITDYVHYIGDRDFAEGLEPEILQKIRPVVRQIEAPREVVAYEPGPNPEYSKAEYRILIDSAKDYFRATKPGYDWDRDAHNRFARIIWQDFKVYLKGRGVAAKDVNRMRMRFFDMCEHVKTLRVVLR